MLKVGVDTRFYTSKPTGIGRYTYEIIKELNTYNDLDLVFIINKSSPLINDNLFIKNKMVIVNEKLFSFGELISLGKKIDKLSLDLFYSPSFILPNLKKTKAIMTILDLIHLKFPQDYTILHKLYYEIIVRKSLNYSSKIITISNFSKQEINEWFPNNKTTAIYPAVSDDFKPCLGYLDDFKGYNFNSENFILFIGNNKTHKNLSLLLASYLKVKEKYPNYYDLILNCKLNKKNKKFVRDNFLEGNVICFDYIPEEYLTLLYSKAVLTVCPSSYEGFGLPVLEALACGCPVLASDSASLPEVGGNVISYFESNNINSLSQKLEMAFLDNLIPKVTVQERLNQAKKFSWKKKAFEIYKLYKKV